MTNEIRCKRIINGKTYNTETAALLGQWEDDIAPIEQALFKTRHGAYFLWTTEQQDDREWIRPLTAEAAQKWMEDNRPDLTDVIEAEFGEAPEAGDPEARITLRVPETLRKRIAAIAEQRDQSVNAWLVRCIERCTEEAEMAQ